MRSLCILTVVFAIANAYMKIDELISMITDVSDRYELRRLERDTMLSRQDLEANLKAILLKQPADVQDAYSRLLEAEQLENDGKYQMQQIILRNMGASQAVLNALDQIRALRMDMTTSRREINAKVHAIEHELKYGLPPIKRRRSDFVLSSEDFF